MAILSRLQPSVAVNGLLVPQVQDVPFLEYIGHSTNFGNGATDAAYIASITNINGEAIVGQQWGQEKAKSSYTLGQIQAPFYRVEAYIEWNVNEQARFEALSGGVALPDFLRNLATQAINQRAHEGILYGFDPATDLSQGILANATISNLPQDSAGADTLTTYNMAELQVFLAEIIRSVRNASFGMLVPTKIASSSRVINYLLSAIVPLTESQKEGAGVDTPAGMLNRVLNWLGAGQVKFIEDNTLQDDTNGDKIVFVSTGLDKQISTQDSQNLVGQFNSVNYNTWYDRGQGLVNHPGVMDKGVYSELLEFKMTPGVTLRKEAVRVVTAKYV